MKRFFKWVSIIVASVVLIPLVVLIVVNAFDEKPDPKITNYGVPRTPTVPEAENGYYALIALSAPDGADASAYARAWIEESRAAAKENRTEKRADAKRAPSQVCDAAQTSCLAMARDKADEVKTQLDASRQEIERYEKLIAFRRYEEVLDFPLRLVAAFPNYGAVAAAQRAYLLRAAAAAESGNIEGAIAAAERDVAFQRVMLAGSRTLIGKMVAAANYWRALAFVSDLMQSRGADLTPYHARLQALLQPMEAAHLNLAGAIETEFEANRNLFKNPIADQGDGRSVSVLERVGVSLFYKPNASVNRSYQMFLKTQTDASKPANQVAAARAVPMIELVEGPKMGWWDYIDNPIANILLNIATPDFRQYALRLHDVDAFSRLVALRAAMLAAAVNADGAGEFAAKSDARFNDPYTLKPVEWDAAAKQLWFKPYASNANQKRFNTAAGRVYLQL